MAKRFTDTTKWNTKYIRELKPAYKLLWLYIQDECNHAGIWDVDFEVAQIKIGIKVDEKDAIKLFADKISLIESGQKWFIPSFIEFQYGQLSENNRAHTQVICLLTKYNLLNNQLIIKPLTSPLYSPLQGDKEQEQEQDKDKEKEQEQGKPLEAYINFIEWIKNNATEVGKMKNKFTEEQFKKISEKYNPKKIKQVLLEMHNWKPLNQKRVDAYLTFLKFAENTHEQKPKEELLPNGLTQKENDKIFGT